MGVLLQMKARNSHCIYFTYLTCYCVQGSSLVAVKTMKKFSFYLKFLKSLLFIRIHDHRHVLV